MPVRRITNWTNDGNSAYFPRSSVVAGGLVPAGQQAGSRPAGGYQVAGTGVAQGRPRGGYPVAGTLAGIRAQHKQAP